MTFAQYFRSETSKKFSISGDKNSNLALHPRVYRFTLSFNRKEGNEHLAQKKKDRSSPLVTAK